MVITAKPVTREEYYTRGSIIPLFKKGYKVFRANYTVVTFFYNCFGNRFVN